MSLKRCVAVPASSANLGPGFDTFAAAIGLRLELEVEETGRFAVHTDLPVRRDATNLCVSAFARLHPIEKLSFTIRSEIPLAGGFGSSAAAIVAGMTAAKDMFGLDADVMGEASAMEGHPDNVAAACSGGFVICVERQVTRFEPPTGLEALAVVPKKAVSTRKARSVLPEKVSLADASFNIGSAGVLMLGLAKGDWDLISRGLNDRLHERWRAPLFERSYGVVTKARELGALGATISGAGPSVLVWCFYEQTGVVEAALEREASGWAQVVRAPFEPVGVTSTAG